MEIFKKVFSYSTRFNACFAPDNINKKTKNDLRSRHKQSRSLQIHHRIMSAERWLENPENVGFYSCQQTNTPVESKDFIFWHIYAARHCTRNETICNPGFGVSLYCLHSSSKKESPHINMQLQNMDALVLVVILQTDGKLGRNMPPLYSNN